MLILNYIYFIFKRQIISCIDKMAKKIKKHFICSFAFNLANFLFILLTKTLLLHINTNFVEKQE